jgi:RNA polymerase sigma-70 factor (ECF subfamily)
LSQHQQVEHIFRHEYGKLVALLVGRIGVHHLDIIEDAVQWSMMQSLDSWCVKGAPTNGSAWLYQVAYRHLISELRSQKRKEDLLKIHFFIDEKSTESTDITLSGEMSDSLLRMLFVACDDGIPIESQLVFTLKSLCGFSIREIATRLFITKDNVYKRFSRAKQYLRENIIELDTLTDAEISTRLPSVYRVLYLFFTEGYLSSHVETAIRQDLCEEAIRLAKLLADSTFGNVAEIYALLALMYFHLARMSARQDDSGALLLLEQQDRSQWDKQHILTALNFLALSSEGENISRFHIEAGIAAEHCLSPSFKQTRWDNIVYSYLLLEHIAPSPLNQLNRAIATAEWRGPEAGLAVLTSITPPHWLTLSYLWSCVLADLKFRCGDYAQSLEHAKSAIALAPTESIKKLLFKRLKKCGL